MSDVLERIRFLEVSGSREILMYVEFYLPDVLVTVVGSLLGFGINS